MAATKTTTRTRRRPTVERAQVSAPTPKVTPNFGVLGLSSDGSPTFIDRSRKARYDIYYEMYKQHPTVRAAIEKIAKVAVANGYRFVPSEADEEVIKTQTDSLRRFFRESNGSQLLRVTYRDLLIYGEAFWLVVRNGRGEPISALRLHPKYMDEKLTAGMLTGWRFGPIGDSKDAHNYKSEEVLHFKFDDPDNDIRGLSLLSGLEMTVASDLFAMKFNERFFENSAHTGIIFNMKNSTADEVARNREWMEQNYVGTENAHKPLILEGDIDVQKSMSTRAEMQFIEGRKFNRQEILSVLDVDPSKIGVNEDSNRSVSKEADNTFRQENVSPLQLVVEEEINNHLIMKLYKWEDIQFRQNDASRRDQLDMMKLYAEAERLGVMSINQVKGELGLPPIDGGDVHFVQTAAGAIPVEWLDDVAKRLIGPSGQPMSGAGTANQPGPAGQSSPTPPVPSGSGSPANTGPGDPGQSGTNQQDG
jgi:HK97 family phage portal protein